MTIVLCTPATSTSIFPPSCYHGDILITHSPFTITICHPSHHHHHPPNRAKSKGRLGGTRSHVHVLPKRKFTMAGVEGEHYLECVTMTMQWEVLVEKVWRGWMARKWYECSGVVVCQHSHPFHSGHDWLSTFCIAGPFLSWCP